MINNSDFDLRAFLPYLLNQAAEASSATFQAYYKNRYGMLRTEWRVLFHLGRYGKMTAKDICTRAKIHKTKVSRAVQALQGKRLLSRTPLETDRRNEVLSLTRQGEVVFDDLAKAAEAYDKRLAQQFSIEEQAILRSCLKRIARL
ncbi:MAG: MarR family winged helix-turn-helix transcriptional regulator [Geminicoccaceae bacterium]